MALYQKVPCPSKPSVPPPIPSRAPPQSMNVTKEPDTNAGARKSAMTPPPIPTRPTPQALNAMPGLPTGAPASAAAKIPFVLALIQLLKELESKPEGMDPLGAWAEENQKTLVENLGLLNIDAVKKLQETTLNCLLKAYQKLDERPAVDGEVTLQETFCSNHNFFLNLFRDSIRELENRINRSRGSGRSLHMSLEPN